ncbi:hypothetical protein OH687_31230 [Burkholderia anthina]|nr:hypothetical protein OH687_31230 [Burkholderia anthina]
MSGPSEVENTLNQRAGVSFEGDLPKCAPAGTATAPGSTCGGLRINA